MVSGVQTNVRLREPTPADGKQLWALARTVGLDENSPYAYLMMCRFFPSTCIVAECEGEVVGFVSGLRPESDPESVLVWQVGVAPALRGKGVGLLMLRALLAREACRNVRFLDATVTSSNVASQRLFQGLARSLGTRCKVSDCFPAAVFPAGSGHEAEHLFRIGPLESPMQLDGGVS